MQAYSPSHRKHPLSASVTNISTTSLTTEIHRRKSERVKIALKSIGSYFASEDPQPSALGSLNGGIISSVVLAAPIATVPSRHLALPISIPAHILNSVALSISPLKPQSSSIPDPPPHPTLVPQARYMLWEKAFESLSERDQQALNLGDSNKPDTLQKVIDITKEKRDICIEKQWKLTYNGNIIVLRDVADKLLTWIRKFQQIGNFLVQVDTAHAALPWEAFKFLLHVIGGDNAKMGSILIALEKIAVLMDRCAIYEGLYLKPENNGAVFRHLENELVSLYMTVLRTLSKAKRFYEQNTAVRMMTSIFDIGGIEPSLDEMDRKEKEVIKTASQAEASSELQKLRDILVDIENPLTIIHSNVSDLHRALEESKRVEILTWLSKITYKQHHDKASKGRVEQTGNWFLEKDIFKEWKKPYTSGMLWLRGAPGTGKTKLTSLVVNHLLNDLKGHNQSEGFAYFYCNRDKKKRRDPDFIFRAILKQLSYRADAHSIHQLVISEYERRKGEAFVSGGMALQESKGLIIDLLKTCPQTTIIIDALDECDPQKREGLLDALKEIAASPNNPVKIFVSSQDKPDISRSFKNVPNFLIDATENAQDIHRFVEFSVRQRIENQKLLGGNVDEELEELICSTLQQNANGTFLLVQRQIEALCNLDTELEVKDVLAMLHVEPTLIEEMKVTPPRDICYAVT